MNKIETYTIWVCICCMLVAANGECCADDEHGGDSREPLSQIGEYDSVCCGMGWEDHERTCLRRAFEYDGYTMHPCSCGVLPLTPWDEHEMDCPVYIAGDLGADHMPGDYECDCETNSFSHSPCEACGSRLYGERHALTVFFGERKPAAV